MKTPVISFLILANFVKPQPLDILLKSITDQNIPNYEILLFEQPELAANPAYEVILNKYASNLSVIPSPHLFYSESEKIEILLQHTKAELVSILTGKYLFTKNALCQIISDFQAHALDVAMLGVSATNNTLAQYANGQAHPLGSEAYALYSAVAISVGGMIDSLVFRRPLIDHTHLEFFKQARFNVLMDIALLSDITKMDVRFRYFSQASIIKNIMQSTPYYFGGMLASEIQILLQPQSEQQTNTSLIPNQIRAEHIAYQYASDGIDESYIKQLALEMLQTQTSDRLAVFLNIGDKTSISGGILVINKFVNLSKQLGQEFNLNAFHSCIPLDVKTYQYNYYDSIPVIPFHFFVRYTKPSYFLINVPECKIKEFLDYLTDEYREWLLAIPELRVNILNQNQELMSPVEDVAELIALIPNVSITTAFVRYTTQELADTYQCPVYLLTPPIDEYYFKKFEEKQKIILLSPDLLYGNLELTLDIYKYLRANLPDYNFFRVANIRYEDYKFLISQAKFSITLGEGFDGYLGEPMLSGSVGFAIYNDIFFPKGSEHLENIYTDLQDFMNNIVADIRDLESNKERYEKINTEFTTLIDSLYGKEITLKNMRDFYLCNPTYVPQLRQLGIHS